MKLRMEPQCGRLMFRPAACVANYGVSSLSHAKFSLAYFRFLPWCFLFGLVWVTPLFPLQVWMGVRSYLLHSPCMCILTNETGLFPLVVFCSRDSIFVD